MAKYLYSKQGGDVVCYLFDDNAKQPGWVDNPYPLMEGFPDGYEIKTLTERPKVTRKTKGSK